MTAPTPAVLALVPREVEGCSLWRVWAPYAHLQKRGVPVAWGYGDDERVAGVAEHFEAVLWCRIMWDSVRTAKSVIGALHRARKLVFYEIDDDIFVHRNEQKDQDKLMEEAGKAPDGGIAPELARQILPLFDGVTVSSERLRTIIGSFAPDVPVEVIPNAIDLTYWENTLGSDPRAFRHDDLRGKTTIGWFGGNRFGRDLEAVGDAWGRVAAEHPYVHFVTMGHNPEPLARSIPQDRHTHIAWMPLLPKDGSPPYPVGVSQIDIGCASVAETVFNSSKTAIKAWEYTAAGACVVGSRWLYGSVIEHGKTGYVAETADEWYEALRALAEKDYGQRRAMHRRMLKVVRDRYSLRANAWRWPAAYTALASAAQERGTMARFTVEVAA